MRVAMVGLLGQTECREDRGEAWRQASTIQIDHQQRHPGRGGSFFDIAFLDESGRPSIALRYVPSLRLTRQSRPQGPVWYRARAALVRELDLLTAGSRAGGARATPLRDPIRATG
jgi:hypothetical protein